MKRAAGHKALRVARGRRVGVAAVAGAKLFLAVVPENGDRRVFAVRVRGAAPAVALAVAVLPSAENIKQEKTK